jgi:hypothetical protein
MAAPKSPRTGPVLDAGTAGSIARRFMEQNLGMQFFTVSSVKKVGQEWHVSIVTLSGRGTVKINALDGGVVEYG